jgi:hypothetical protein
LPLGSIASGDPPTSLPQRNLLRHLTWSLPSGQDVARAMGIRALGPGELSELATFGAGFERSTPLWYYILKEAELAGGTQLTGVGARIVAEASVCRDRQHFQFPNLQNPSKSIPLGCRALAVGS